VERGRNRSAADAHMYVASVRMSVAPASRTMLDRVPACRRRRVGSGGYAGTGITPARTQPISALMKRSPGGNTCPPMGAGRTVIRLVRTGRHRRTNADTRKASVSPSVRATVVSEGLGGSGETAVVNESPTRKTLVVRFATTD
jgi:hypothetical protein